MRIKTKVEIVLNTDGTWEVTRFLSGPTKQVKLGDKKLEKTYGRAWYNSLKKSKPTPVQDALDNARKVRRAARRHDWSNTTRQVQQCTGCGHPNVNIRTCRGDGTHRPAKHFWGRNKRPKHMVQ